MNATDLPHHLQCPATGGALQWMSPEELGRVRDAVADGLLVNRAGALVTDLPEAMLVCLPAGLGYVVESGIPVLIAEQAIALEQIQQPEGGLINEENADGGNRFPENHR